MNQTANMSKAAQFTQAEVDEKRWRARAQSSAGNDVRPSNTQTAWDSKRTGSYNPQPWNLTSYGASGTEATKRSQGSKAQDTSTLFFYERDRPYYEFTNFASYDVEYRGKIYPTSEHLFQARKFIDSRPELAEQIRTTPNSRAALETATRLRKLQRSDWYNVNISVMEEVVLLKFTQHRKLYEMLLGTGDRELVEASPVDAFWGYGHDRKGRNELGKALMKIRDQLRRNQLSVVSATPIAASSRTTSQASVAPASTLAPAGPRPMNITSPPPRTSSAAGLGLPSSPRKQPPVVPPKPNPLRQNSTKSEEPSLFSEFERSDKERAALHASNESMSALAPPLFFYEPGEPFWELMNISQHAVWHEGKRYSTAEHLFHAFMFLDTPRADLAEEIRVQNTWLSAVRLANNNTQHQRTDWDEVKISCMEAVVAAKFSQHDDALTMLLSTGERQLVYNSPYDSFWGCGKDGQGKNEFGKILANMRTVLALRRTTRASVDAAIANEQTSQGCTATATVAMPSAT